MVIKVRCIWLDSLLSYCAQWSTEKFAACKTDLLRDHGLNRCRPSDGWLYLALCMKLTVVNSQVVQPSTAGKPSCVHQVRGGPQCSLTRTLLTCVDTGVWMCRLLGGSKLCKIYGPASSFCTEILYLQVDHTEMLEMLGDGCHGVHT